MSLRRRASASGAAASPPVDDAEVMALVLHWLARGPCADAAAALARDAERRGLLPPRYDVQGGRHAQTYAQLLALQPALPPDALPQLLAQVVAAKRQCGAPGALVRRERPGWGRRRRRS